MSKYEDLCGAFSLARERTLSERNECSEFATKVFGDLLKSLEWPPNLVAAASIRELGKDVEDGLNGAERDSEGWWHRVANLGLSTLPNMYPEFRFLVDISVTKRGSNFIVKSPPDRKEFELERLGDPEGIAFNEHVFRLIKAWLDGKLDVSSGTEPRIVGFIRK